MNEAAAADSPEPIARQIARLLPDQPPLAALLARIEADQALPVAQALKKIALAELRRDAQRATEIAAGIARLGENGRSPHIQALSRQTLAIIETLARRSYERALDLFDEAAAVFKAEGDDLELAVTQVSRIWALACVQRYDEAFAAGAWAHEVLEQHGARRSLAALNNNLVAIHGRRGDDHQALQRLEAVLAAYEALGDEGRERLPLALINRAILLRNLGRFPESLAANEQALTLAEERGQTAHVARARQNLGITCFALGEMARAQTLLEEARALYAADGRFRDAILTDLFLTDGLLHLRRFEEVIEKCRQARAAFDQAGTRFEIAQAWLNEAIALAGLGRLEAAAAAVTSARAIFDEEQNPAWQAVADLEMGGILARQERPEEARALVERALAALRPLALPVREAQGHLLLGDILLQTGDLAAAQEAIEQGLQLARERDVPALTYQAHFLRGRLRQAQHDPAGALAAFEAAIRQLERLQGQIMVEFRADFLVDKQAVYVEAVRLCLAADNPAAALQLAERARSRALLELVTHRVDLRLDARTPADEERIETLRRLREERNRLHRRWETHEIPGNESHQQPDQRAEQENREQLRRDILRLEDALKKSWHRLLVHNRAYAREAFLWQVDPTQPLPAIPPGTALIEYFSLGEALVAFVAEGDRVTAHSLPLTAGEATRRQQQLKHALETVARTPAAAAALLPKTQALLAELHAGLLAPLRPAVRRAARLIFVPFGSLHYLPWHALFDGEERRYLLADHEVSVLPSALLLDHLAAAPAEIGEEVLLLGHSHRGALPQIHHELAGIARVVGRPARLDREATRAHFQARAGGSGLIHLAAHGEFRRAEPLFSGLQLEDGLLTTLDVFNIRLHAALVCLSGCETGRAVLGGGDELFGLMRAFLAGGADSLVMSLWRVEDESTARLMTGFYEALMRGAGKGEALRQAQLALAAEGGAWAHPFHWAPFFLVGDTGPLPPHLRPRP